MNKSKKTHHLHLNNSPDSWNESCSRYYIRNAARPVVGKEEAGADIHGNPLPDGRGSDSAYKGIENRATSVSEWVASWKLIFATWRLRIEQAGLEDAALAVE